MPLELNISDAKARLSELLERALEGEEVVIARAGKPLVRLVPVAHGKGRAGFFGALVHLGPVPAAALTPEAADADGDWHEEPLSDPASPRWRGLDIPSGWTGA